MDNEDKLAEVFYFLCMDNLPVGVLEDAIIKSKKTFPSNGKKNHTIFQAMQELAQQVLQEKK